MAGSVNKVIIVGNLGRDPETRRLGSGEPVVNLRIATSESWRDRNSGDRRERTEWHNVVIFNDNLAKVAEQYLKKAMKVYIEGQLQTRKWQDQQGQDRYTTEIKAQRVQFLDRKGDGPRGGGQGGYEDDYGTPAQHRGSPRNAQPTGPRGGQEGAPRGNQGGRPQAQPPRQQEEDLGPAFPSEASNMDDVPF